jgi:outer membrane autotransporter protein
VEVEIHAPSCTTVATNRVESAVANQLDRIMPTVQGDLANVLDEFQSLSLSQFDAAFSSLSPDSYDNYTRATFWDNWQYTKSLQRRMNAVRSFGMTSGYHLESKPLLLAFAGSDASLGQLYATRQLSQTQTENGLWLDGYGQWGDQEPDEGFTGFDYQIYGGILGFDHTFWNKLITGLSLGLSHTDVDLDRHQGDGNIKSLIGSLYGSYFNENFYIEGSLSYGSNGYNNHRLLTIGSIQREAYSDHDGDLFSAYLGGGYYFDVKDWAIGPFGSLRYVYLNEEGFREKGADSLNLNVDPRKTDALLSELGLRAAGVFKTQYGDLIPELSGAWSYDFDIDNRVITASFEGSPGAAFSVKGQDVEKNGAVVGAGLTFIHKSGISSSIRYSGEFREKYNSNAVIGEFRLSF